MAKKLQPRNDEDKALSHQARAVAADLRATAAVLEARAAELDAAASVDVAARKRFAKTVITAEAYLRSPRDPRPTEAASLKQAARAMRLLDAADRWIVQLMTLDPHADRAILVNAVAKVIELQEQESTRADRVVVTEQRWVEALTKWSSARQGALDGATRARRKANPAEAPSRWQVLGRLIGVDAATVKAKLFRYQ